MPAQKASSWAAVTSGRSAAGECPASGSTAAAAPSRVGHRGLQRRRPHVVVLAEQHQHRQAERGQLVGAVGLGEQLLGHPVQPHRVVGDEPVVQPRLDLGRAAA